MTEQTRRDSDILKEISQWKLEAADEDSARYFYHLSDVASLEDGKNSIVIGRKGTGKTAICRYFETSVDYNRFSLKLSFKEFPFNLLYSLEDKNFTTPSQYISLWKYFIYNSVLKMMASNENVNAEFKRKIEVLYPNDEFRYIGSIMESWTKRGFGAGIFGLSANASQDRAKHKLEDIWQDLIPAMEMLITRNIDKSAYFIVFDELDEDYRNYWDETARFRYISLVTSLMKAVSNVRRVFGDHNCNIKPIVFLRDDIYELLSDPDKNKWEDHKVNLSWRKEELKRMLSFRIARSRDPKAKAYHFEREWEELFSNYRMPVGNPKSNKTLSSFDYITELTHSRPRDMVRFLRDAARSSINQGHRLISADTIRGVDGDFSNHFREEIVNEIGGLIPDINLLLSHLGATHKQRYRYNDFISEIESYQEGEDCNAETKRLSSVSVAKILFHFSIIGNAPQNRSPIFKYQRSHLTLNASEPIVVHRGLVKSMGLH